MNANTKLEVAKEIIYEKIGSAVKEKNLTVNDAELVELLNIKNEVNKGNMEAIDYVLEHMSIGGKK